MPEVVRALTLFALAGPAEIGGGWLVWQWLREHRPWFVGALGGLVLVLYGVILTLQQEPNFGRVYAANGGVFVVLSLLWGWRVDGWVPDHWDWREPGSACLAYWSSCSRRGRRDFLRGGDTKSPPGLPGGFVRLNNRRVARRDRVHSRFQPIANDGWGMSLERST
jgi:small multidrug resistance family-3 protein